MIVELLKYYQKRILMALLFCFTCLRSEGKNPHVILRGGSTYTAMFAYISAFEEMIQQVNIY